MYAHVGGCVYSLVHDMPRARIQVTHCSTCAGQARREPEGCQCERSNMTMDGYLLPPSPNTSLTRRVLIGPGRGCLTS